MSLGFFPHVVLRHARAILVVAFRCPNISTLILVKRCRVANVICVWSRSTPSWYQKDWKPKASGGDRASEGQTGWKHSRHQLQRSGGQHRDMENTSEKVPADCAELWKLQKILTSREGSLSQTYKNSTEANTKVYDLNQRTMQAHNNLALIFASFEPSGANLEVEISEEDLPFADAYGCGRACRSSTAPGTFAR